MGQSNDLEYWLKCIAAVKNQDPSHSFEFSPRTEYTAIKLLLLDGVWVNMHNSKLARKSTTDPDQMVPAYDPLSTKL